MDFDGRTADILLCKINGHRTLPALVNILNGNRTAQTIADMYMFQLEPYAGALKYAPDGVKTAFERTLSQSFHNKDDEVNEKQNLNFVFPAAFHGMKYEWTGRASKLWECLSLFIQTLSHVKQSDRFFFPVSSERSAQLQVKAVLRKRNVIDVSDRLYAELTQVLQELNEPVQNLFVDRLTVKNEVGLSFSQLAERYKMTPLEAYISVRSVLHAMLLRYDSAPPGNSVLGMLMPKSPDGGQQGLTDSAKQTKELLDQGQSPDGVARIRKLKLSTVEDHIVELAHVVPDFDYSPYLNDKDLQEIKKQIYLHNLSRLRELKEATGGHYSYLQLRIGMAAARRTET